MVLGNKSYSNISFGHKQNDKVVVVLGSHYILRVVGLNIFQKSC